MMTNKGTFCDAPSYLQPKKLRPVKFVRMCRDKPISMRLAVIEVMFTACRFDQNLRIVGRHGDSDPHSSHVNYHT